MKLTFTKVKDTQNKTRFAESVPDGTDAKDTVGTLYVPATYLEKIKDYDPEKGVTVAIAAVK